MASSEGHLETHGLDQSPQEDSHRRPSLLPAFEPLSSSPLSRVRPAKRKFPSTANSALQEPRRYYPTPVATSETGVLASSSSSPSRGSHYRPGENGHGVNRSLGARPALSRTVSTLTERVPLGAMPSVTLPESGEPVRLGRSSSASDYRLSSSRLISRIHVETWYEAAQASSHPYGRVHISCVGWNGTLVHCQGQVVELDKGARFIALRPDADIMLDILDTRVMVKWPPTAAPARNLIGSPATWDSPERVTGRSLDDPFRSSPPDFPPSPTPAGPLRLPTSAARSPVRVYEDADLDENPNHSNTVPEADFVQPSRSTTPSSPLTKVPRAANLLASFTAAAAAAAVENVSDAGNKSDADEENDPIVHAFGPFGDNLLPRLAAFSTDAKAKPSSDTQLAVPAQRRRRAPLALGRPIAEPVRRLPSPLPAKNPNESPIKNHVVNQLAFSRLRSVPLSTLLGNLPTDLKSGVDEEPRLASNRLPATEEIVTGLGIHDGGSDASLSALHRSPSLVQPAPLTASALKAIVDDIPCVGEIPRQGKDAAGKPLENEYYYVPEMDANDMRRDAVMVSHVGGSGLREVRKSHKVRLIPTVFAHHRPKHQRFGDKGAVSMPLTLCNQIIQLNLLCTAAILLEAASHLNVRSVLFESEGDYDSGLRSPKMFVESGDVTILLPIGSWTASWLGHLSGDAATD